MDNAAFNTSVSELEFLACREDADELFTQDFADVWKQVCADTDKDRRAAHHDRLRKLCLVQAAWMLVMYHKAKDEHEAQEMQA